MPFAIVIVSLFGLWLICWILSFVPAIWLLINVILTTALLFAAYKLGKIHMIFFFVESIAVLMFDFFVIMIVANPEKINNSFFFIILNIIPGVIVSLIPVPSIKTLAYLFNYDDNDIQTKMNEAISQYACFALIAIIWNLRCFFAL